MSIQLETTQRGFVLGEFADHYGASCSIQKSSLAGEDCIWLGIDDPEPKYCVYGQGWFKYELPKDVHICGRMHLTQEMAADLIPLLQGFVETGELIAKAPDTGPVVRVDGIGPPQWAHVVRNSLRYRVRLENIEAGDYIERLEHYSYGIDFGFLPVVEGEVVEEGAE